MNRGKLLILASVALAGVLLVGGAYGRIAYLSPSSMYVAPGGMASLAIEYDDQGDPSQALQGYDIKLQFAPSTIGLDDAYKGDFLGEPAYTFFHWDILQPDTAWVVEARLVTTGPAGVTGAGTLATVVFEGLIEGTSAITFGYAAFRDTFNTPISVTTTGGSVTVDGTGPPTPTLTSSTHTEDVWSSNNDVTVDWRDVIDLLSGTDGYYMIMDDNATTVPTTSDEFVDVAVQTKTYTDVADGNDWYIHIVAVDNVGNLGAADHYGPIKIDTGAPPTPTLTSATHTEDVWSSDNDVTVDWTDVVDTWSGTDGYYMVRDHNASTVPTTSDEFVDVAVQTKTYTDVADGDDWYIHIVAVDNVGNLGAADHYGPIKIDTGVPGDITGLGGEPGHNKVTLTWTNPAGKQSPLAGTLIRRVAWGNYPWYLNGDEPNYPSTPTEGDFVAFVPYPEETYTNTESTRDIYYYTAFAQDEAGNYSSAVSTAQGRATSYWLGDVTDGTGVGNYDGYVDFEDLIILSNCFGSSEGGLGWEAEFDIGPTHNNRRTGIPEPDSVINFEDLMIFAMNFWHTSPLVTKSDASNGVPIVSLQPSVENPSMGGEFEVRLLAQNCVGMVKGMHLVIGFDGSSVELVEAIGSDMSEGAVFSKVTTGQGRIELDFAVLGTNATMTHSGELARFNFKRLSEDRCEVALQNIDLRNQENETLQCHSINVLIPRIERFEPEACLLGQNWPNPFSEQTQIRYQIPKDARVALSIYDITGKLVRNVVCEEKGAGYYTECWDGKDGIGNVVAPGVYFCRLEVGTGVVLMRKMVVVR